MGRLPEITHLQFLILGVLMSDEMLGQDLRDALASQGVKKDGPAFYQLMARLEDAGFVKGWYDQQVIHGQIFKQRKYKLTGQGAKTWNSTRDFYLDLAKQVKQGGLAHA